MTDRKKVLSFPIFILLPLISPGLTSCGNEASFKSGMTSSSADVGQSDSSTIPPIETPHSDDGTAGTKSPSPTTGGETDLKDMSPEKCAEWFGGKPEDVIKYRKASDLALNESSIIFFDLFGKTTINLTSDSISSIKGICIRSTKFATATLSVGFSVDSLAYYGRNKGTTNIVFQADKNLKRLQHDIKGGQDVQLSGPSLDCGSFDLETSQSATMTCNNQ